MASPKMSLKLLVNKKGQKVLFAEATKEFVDFLVHVFSLPLGTLIEFLGSKQIQMVGCLGKLKESIENLHETYLQPGVKKDDIFNPKIPFNGNTFLLSYEPHANDYSPTSKAIYRCSNASEYSAFCDEIVVCGSYATLEKGAKCPKCGSSMNVMMNSVTPEEKAAAVVDKNLTRGYVKEVVTYMVMDDLVVKPMSTISSITLINNFGVKDLSQLEEKVVSFGKDEALKLLKASLMTDDVLTCLFLHNNNV